MQTNIFVCGLPQNGFYRSVGEILGINGKYNVMNNNVFINFYMLLKSGHISLNFIKQVFDVSRIGILSKRTIFVHGIIDGIAILTYIQMFYKKFDRICNKYISILMKLYNHKSGFVAYFLPKKLENQFQIRMSNIFINLVESLTKFNSAFYSAVELKKIANKSQKNPKIFKF